MIRIATGEKFIPQFQDGAEDGKPYTFNLHYLTPDEREQVNIIYVPVKASKRGVSIKSDLKEAFLMGVQSIDNLSIELDGVVKEIKTPEEFLKYPLPELLYQEVALRIKETSGIQEKN